MKLQEKLVAIFVSTLLAACGGGGSGSTTAPTTSVNPGTSDTTTITNPLTGTAAPGTATKAITGIANSGATVSAYAVQPDGSNGASLGVPATANSFGEFSLTLNVAPTGMVRLIATGGTVKRTADNTTQANKSMELVTPFVTSSFQYFKITPMSHIGSQVMAYKAKNGATLANAFKAGMRSTLELDVANVFMLEDTNVYLNMLKGAIKSDSFYYNAQSAQASELLSGLEWFGVMYDLPVSDVLRVIATSAENSYPLGGLNGAGQAINAGAWVNGSFDATSPVTLEALMSAKTPAAQKVTDSKTSTTVTPRVSDFISKYMIMDMAVYAACRGAGTAGLTSRYPYYVVDSNGAVPAADCSAVNLRIADLQARIATNNSSTLK